MCYYRKHWLTVFFTAFLVLNGRAGDPVEPSFDGKPISYWLEGLWSTPPKDAPALADSIRACGKIGWSGVPYLLSQPWTNSAGLLDTARPARLNAVVSLFTAEEKRKVRRSIWKWMKSPEVQIQAAAVSLRPSNPPYMLALKLSKARKSSDPLIQLAFDFKTRQPLLAGWEPGYEMRVSPQTPRAVIQALQMD